MNKPAYSVDGQPAGAEAFYALACDPQRSVVVEACAGAGKTWILVSRVLRALLEGVPPQHILAITFTRKAAGEMRERLDAWVHDFAVDNSSHDERVQALRQRGCTPAQAQALAPRLGGVQEALLLSGREVVTSTFHAWFAQLLAQAPLSVLEQMGLPARHELVEDTSLLQAELMRRTHRRIQHDPVLRERYVELVQRYRRGTVMSWLEAAWARAADLTRADLAGNAEDSVPAAAALYPAMRGRRHAGELLRQHPLATELTALASQLGQGGGVRKQEAAAKLLAALETEDPEAALTKAVDALITQKGTPRVQLGDSPQLKALQEQLLALGPMQRQQQAHEDHVALLSLARVLLAEYQALKHQRGLVDMADLERAAEILLTDSQLAGWVQERLDQRVRQLLIDEFQDTNPLQWQVLQGWLSAYAGAGGGASGQAPPAVFLVGDPKQSIYRFRGAEPRVFEAARAFVLQGLAGRFLACDHTRRNATRVVDTLNAVFADAAQVDGWGPYRPHTTESPVAGDVLGLPGVPRSAQEEAAPPPQGWRDSLTQARTEPETLLRSLEAAQVADAVTALIQKHGLAPAEVMVLARRRSMLALVAQALAERGVPHVVAEKLALHQAPEALDLAAVLDVLVSPGHDLSLARALRSPIFGADDADLLWLAAQAQGQKTPWLTALCQGMEPTSSALQRARGLLRTWQGLVHQLPPHDLLQRIASDGDVFARVAAAVPAARRALALHTLHALLGASLHHEGGRFTSAYTLLRALRAGELHAPGAAGADAVQLLTVHGAKGLEARAVVLADSDPEKRPPERASVLVDWPVQHNAPRRVAFVRNAAELAPSLADAWAERQATADREELNGLYVAMTRAREWLVFSHTEPYQRDAGLRSWWQRLQPHAKPWQPPAAQALPAEPTVLVPAAPTLNTWPAPASPDSTHNVHTARLGQAVHRVLEWATSGQLDLQHAAAAAAQQAGLEVVHAAEVARVAQTVLASPSCAPLLRPQGQRWAGNEVPMAWQGQVLRIDRLVQQGSTWWVLDYKLVGNPAADPALRQQLAQYVAAVQALQPGEPVQGAFITGLGELIPL
jgi:ATP-dependent helicase/nuclease subunit A